MESLEIDKKQLDEHFEALARYYAGAFEPAPRVSDFLEVAVVPENKN